MIGLGRGPFAPLPEGAEIVLGLDAHGGAGYLWRDVYRTHLGRQTAYDTKRMNVVVIRQPGERGAPRATATSCVSDGRIAYDTVAALGLAVDRGPLLWTAYERDQAPRSMFSMLVAITDGWRFPTPLRRLLPVPKLGEVLVAVDNFGAFYSFINDAKEDVTVVLRHDGQELQARITLLAAGPFVRWNLTDHACEVGCDPLNVQFNRVMGAEAERVGAYLSDAADRGLFTMPGCGLRLRRKM